MSAKILSLCVIGVLLVPASAVADDFDAWELHSSQRFGLRFKIPPHATWVDETWEDEDGRAWGFAHAFNADKARGERADLFVFAREGGDATAAPRVPGFVKAFTKLPNNDRWTEITPEGATNHKRWVGKRRRDEQVFHVFFGNSSEGAILIILQHPRGHALENEESYRAWYDSIETLQED